jgi:hypothetical protein
MGDERMQADGGEDHEDELDDLCDEKTTLGDDEITSDEDLPAATGGVEE